MKKLFALSACVLSAVVLSGCLADSPSRLLLTEGTLRVLPAPDIHGANHEMEPHSGAVFISGGVRMSGSEKAKAGQLENIQTEESFAEVCEKCGAKPKEDYQFADLFYDVTSFPWYGTIHIVSKDELFTWGMGIGFDDALYLSGSVGINTEYFEVGATVALGIMVSREWRYGLSVGCNQRYVCDYDSCGYVDRWDYREKKYDDFSTTFFGIVSPGIYASAYWGQFSFTYSGSVYWPDNVFYDSSDADKDYIVQTKGDYLPAVFTNHFSVGYMFKNGVGLRLGASQVYGDFEGWHWSGFGGVEIGIL